MAAVAEACLGFQWRLHPTQIHGGGNRGKFGPRMRPGGIGSISIGEVGPKWIHGGWSRVWAGVVPDSIDGICVSEIQRGLIV
eukprot:g43322.t1